MRGLVGKRVVTALAVVVAASAWATSALAAPAPCADVMPLEDVSVGMKGTGYTVAQGTDPETFDVEVLGIARGPFLPGRDVIIVKISGPLVDGPGVWAGMSGSPVYIDDGSGPRLVGALAYGFSSAPSGIAGLTPAEDMLAVGGYPATTASRVHLGRALREKIAARTGTSVSAVSDSLVRLKLPVSVSGLRSDRYRLVRRLLRERGVRSVLYPGGAVSAASTSGTVDDLVPGGNFSAALTYGDLTLAGVGTTSYVCDGVALAFGHPFMFQGRVNLGAGAADALTIVPDVFGSYKLANVTAPIGRLDQDRWAGVRAVDGELSPIPAQATVTSLDTGNTRAGETDVLLKSDFSYLGFLHVVSDIDSVFDEIGAGSSSMEWTIEGKRADGSAWTLHRSNVFFSNFDVSNDSSLELLDELATIQYNPLQKVAFTGLQANVSVEDVAHHYRLRSLRVCRRGSCEVRRRIKAHPGQTIHLKAVLRPPGGSPDETVPFALTIPRRAHHGALVEVGGPIPPEFCFKPARCRHVLRSFDDLLRLYRRQPRNDSLVASLRTGLAGRLRQRESVQFDRVVSGHKRVRIFFPGKCCPPQPSGGVGEEGAFSSF